MLTLHLQSSPEAEAFFATRLFLREKFHFRCPKCKGYARRWDWETACTLCLGRGRVEFEQTCELVK